MLRWFGHVERMHDERMTKQIYNAKVDGCRSRGRPRRTFHDQIDRAVRPVLQDWTKRRHGTLTFRLTQVLSGHGCFGRYLCRLGREPTSGCHHCDTGDEDTALHTLQVCPAWAEQRQDLVAITGLDLSLPAVVRTMVGSRTGWDAVSSFCERVMLAKEEAERERERTSLLRSRQRRTRRRRRASQDLRPP
ncbi:hypothetical protein K1T71_002861 [Dendrolimus kikuchii]|uniref:Uncharacterized protein n=1 Tax=Dendrolimus kikuchii TaxID=765133 RepID=A0ACC1DEF6_9NEOP|nr:hypothetical protein K1T71_002861 [Dendrolimus kikuchii]